MPASMTTRSRAAARRNRSTGSTPFVNQTLANHALALLSRLFSLRPLQYHGGFVSLASGTAVPLRVNPGYGHVFEGAANRGTRKRTVPQKLNI